MQDQQKEDRITEVVYQSKRKSKDSTFFGITVSKGGILPQSQQLDIIFADGNRQAIKYHEITSGTTIDVGCTKIELPTPTLSVFIEGKYLLQLYEYLLEDAVVWIR